MAVSAVALTRVRLSRIDSSTAQLMADAPALTSIHDADGPIAVMARWEIDPDQRASFVAAMEPIRRALKRQDALSFQLVEDVEQPGHMVETFTIATWEYQRLPQRSTVDDSHLHDTLIEGFGPELPDLTAHRVIKL